MPTIAIRVSDEDHKLFCALADREFMPLSVLVRRTLHAEAIRAGLTLDPVAEAKRVLKAEVAQAAEQEPLQPAYGVREDGSISYRLRVAKARTLSKEGLNKMQVACGMGLTLDQIEEACDEVAKQGEVSSVLPWHSKERAFALERTRFSASITPPASA